MGKEKPVNTLKERQVRKVCESQVMQRGCTLPI